MRAITLDELCAELKSNKDRRAVLTFHTIGDRDAVSSAVAISSFFTNARVVTPDFITNNAKKMLAYLNYSDKVTPSVPEQFDLAVVFDANNMFALGKLGDRLVPTTTKIIFVDHHAEHADESVKADIFNDEKYNSTASIVYEVMKMLGVQVDKNAAMLLLNGIIADSADMQNSSPLTFRQVAELLEIAKIDFSFFSEYYHESVPVKNKYQIIIDVFGAKAEVVGKYIMVYGKASEHANIAADTALKLEADVSVFWVEGSTEASVSARLRSPLDKKLSLHLGLIMQEIGDLIGGSGGGHACAAGAYGIRREAAQLAGEETVKRIRQILERANGS